MEEMQKEVRAVFDLLQVGLAGELIRLTGKVWEIEVHEPKEYLTLDIQFKCTNGDFSWITGHAEVAKIASPAHMLGYISLEAQLVVTTWELRKRTSDEEE